MIRRLTLSRMRTFGSTRRAQSSLPEHQRLLSGILEEIACNPDGAPFVFQGLFGNERLASTGVYAWSLMRKFLDGKACFATRGLPQSEKERLRYVMARAPNVQRPGK